MNLERNAGGFLRLQGGALSWRDRFQEIPMRARTLLVVALVMAGSAGGVLAQTRPSEVPPPPSATAAPGIDADPARKRRRRRRRGGPGVAEPVPVE